MLNILQRYIIKKIVFATFLMMIAAMALVYVISFLGELRQLGEGEYGLIQAALYAILELPFNVNQFFPMIVLLGGLSGLGILATHHEWVVMRVSGLSPWRMMHAVFWAGIILSVFGFLLGEGAAPRLHYVANMHKTIELSGGQAVVTQAGLWLHQKNDFIHIKQVTAHHHLEGITRYQFNPQHQLMGASYADSMDYQDGHWVVHHLSRTLFLGTGQTTSESFERFIWEIQLNPVILNAGLIEPEEMPLDKLLFFTRHLVRNGMQAAEFQFSLSRRILRPFAIMVMLFLALSFVFAPPRALTLGFRLFVGVLLGFIFYILNTLLGQLSVIFQWSAWWSALSPIVIFIVLDAWLLVRAFRR